MIYTVTLNPSIDYIVRLDELKTGITNRTTSEEYYIGGKGINVSCVLAELGIKSTALGFVAGFTGEAIEKGLKNPKITADFITLKSGISRIRRMMLIQSDNFQFAIVFLKTQKHPAPCVR